MARTKTTIVAGLGVLLAVAAAILVASTSGRQQPKPKLAPDPVAYSRESAGRATDAKQTLLQCISYANGHNGQLPADLGAAGATFEMVASGDWNAMTKTATVLLRERKPRKSPEGKLVKVYGFADGHVELLSSADGDFAALEKKQRLVIGVPPQTP